MASMKIVQFLRPPTPLVHLRPEFFHPLHVRRPISKEPFPSPNDNQSIKRKLNPRWLLYVIRPFLQVGFRFQYQLINLVWLCTTWKRKQTIEEQTHRTCEQTKSKQKQKKVTSHSNLPRVLLFDLAYKQYNGIIKGWLHCLMPEWKGRGLLVNNILMFGSAWCLVMTQI